MKKIAFTALFGLLSWSAQASLFTDDFNRANTASSTNLALLGSGYATVYPPTNSVPMFQITNNVLKLSGGTAKNVALYQTAVQTLNTNGNSFTVSADITTISAVSGTLLYGLAFNVQTNGYYYALRINTGNTNVLQFLEVTPTNTLSTKNFNIGGGLLATNSVYNLSVSSDTAGVFSFMVTGANLGSGLSGTITAGGTVLSGGYGGIHDSAANVGVSFDNLSITSIPEPATIGMLGIGAFAVVMIRRMRK